jgi:ATP-dependent Clp protease ATP-binding subunit ClpB
VRTGYDPRYGARLSKRAIQKKIETPLGRLLLQGTIKDGQTVAVDVGEGANQFESLSEEVFSPRLHIHPPLTASTWPVI